MEIKLPHGPGFRLIHRSIELTADGTAITEYDYTGSEVLNLNDHLPGQPIFPGVLLLESMAQTAIQCAPAFPELAGYNFSLLGVNKYRIHRIVLPATTVRFEARIDKFRHHIGIAQCQAKADGHLVAEAEILFGILPKK